MEEINLQNLDNPTENNAANCGCENNVKKKCKCGHTIFDIVLAAAVVVLFALHFCGNKNSVTPATPYVPEEGGLKVAYVNTDSLLAKYQYAIDLQEKLVAYKNSQEANYSSQMSQFQRDYTNFLQTGDQLSLSQQQAKEAELKQRAEKLSTLQGELTMKIAQRQTEDNLKLIKAVFAFVKEYNESHQKFDIILRKTLDNSPTLYMNEAMDITNEIIEGLNEEYKSLKKEESKK